MAKKKHRGPGQPRKYEPGKVLWMNLQLPLDLAKRLDKRAKAEGLKRTAAVQQAVREWVEDKR